MRLNETVPQISLSELLRKLSELGGSDLHITTGSPPQVRVDGHLRPLEMDRVLTSATPSSSPTQSSQTRRSIVSKKTWSSTFHSASKACLVSVPTCSTSAARSAQSFAPFLTRSKQSKSLGCPQWSNSFAKNRAA